MTDQRKEFVRKALAAGANLSALCREYGVTRKTGLAWRERARREGLNGVREHSRRPHHSPSRLSEAQVCKLIRLKQAWPTWGPKKLSQLYREAEGTELAISTCHRVLKAAGLIEERVRRVRRPASVIVGAVVPLGPNDVWTVDFKGWWRLGDGHRCEPLTVRDAFSRMILSAHVPGSGRTEPIRDEFIRLFRAHGLPKVIKSDNGVPFASAHAPLGLSALSAGWVALGIQLERSRPAHPQDNGAHERLHKDLAAEVSAHVQVDAVAQQAALDIWRRDYNQIRPHEHLQGRRPAQVYQPSPRSYPQGRLALDYGPGFLPRLVGSSGAIKYRSRTLFISTALAGWHIGLRLQTDQLLAVWFNYLLLGSIDLQTNRFGSAPSRSAKAVGLAA
jgi:putative transposase